VNGDSKFHAIEVLDEGQGQKHTEGLDADQVRSPVLAYGQKTRYQERNSCVNLQSAESCPGLDVEIAYEAY